MVTVPEEVTRYLDAVTTRVRDVFGDGLVGSTRPVRWHSATIALAAVTSTSWRWSLGHRISIFDGDSRGNLIIMCWPARPRAWSLSCIR